MKASYKLTSWGVYFAAFILFLLVGLSLPIIKPIFLFTIRSTLVEQQPSSVAVKLNFGVWGFCAYGQLNDNSETCLGPKLGYNFSSFIDFNEVGISKNVVTIVENALSVVLVLHPVSAGLALLSLIFSLFLASHSLSIFTLILTIINALVSTVSMAINLGLVLVARSCLASLRTISITVDFGNGVWMTVAGVALTWIGVVLLSARACYCLGVEQSSNLQEKHISDT